MEKKMKNNNMLLILIKLIMIKKKKKNNNNYNKTIDLFLKIYKSILFKFILKHAIFFI